MEGELVIRAGTRDDIETLASFQEAMALETEGRRLHAATIRAGVRGLFDEPSRGRYWIAERGGAPVGSLLLTLEWSDWRNGVFWWIQSVFVPEGHRRTGVFAALYHCVEGEARSTPGVVGLRLYVERENTSAQRVYEALGMQSSSYRFYEVDFTAPGPEK